MKAGAVLVVVLVIAAQRAATSERSAPRAPLLRLAGGCGCRQERGSLPLRLRGGPASRRTDYRVRAGQPHAEEGILLDPGIFHVASPSRREGEVSQDKSEYRRAGRVSALARITQPDDVVLQLLDGFEPEIGGLAPLVHRYFER